MFLDFAEDQARRRKQIFLRDWDTRLDDFLRFNERAVLPNAGAMKREEADRRAREEYARFEERRWIIKISSANYGCLQGLPFSSNAWNSPPFNITTARTKR